MARPLRLQFENACYHVISRGNRQESIFQTDRDRRAFLIKADKAFEKYSVACFAYCLMGNHYHLFVKTPLANLSQFMHHLNSAYANWHREKHKTVGPLFQDRFKSILVEEDSYAIELSAYIHLNPVRAKMVEKPIESTWSSYRIYHGMMASPIRKLDPSFILGYFGGNPEIAREKYHEFVGERIQMEDPRMQMPLELRGNILGSENYIERIRSKIERVGRLREVPETRPLPEMSLDCSEILDRLSADFKVRADEFLVKRKNNIYRQLLIFILKKSTGCTLKIIGDFMRMDYVAVAMASKRFEARIIKDPRALEYFQRAESEIEKLRCEIRNR